MSDLNRYIEDRKKNDPEFGDNFESGAHEFISGVLLRQREEAGVTEEEVARGKALHPSLVEKV